MGKAERVWTRSEGLRERALQHVLRRLLLEVLSDGEELTPREMRDRLPTEAPLTMVAYHARILQDAGLVRAVDRRYRLAPGAQPEGGRTRRR